MLYILPKVRNVTIQTFYSISKVDWTISSMERMLFVLPPMLLTTSFRRSCESAHESKTCTASKAALDYRGRQPWKMPQCSMQIVCCMGSVRSVGVFQKTCDFQSTLTSRQIHTMLMPNSEIGPSPVCASRSLHRTRSPGHWFWLTTSYHKCVARRGRYSCHIAVAYHSSCVRRVSPGHMTMPSSTSRVAGTYSNPK